MIKDLVTKSCSVLAQSFDSPAIMKARSRSSKFESDSSAKDVPLLRSVEYSHCEMTSRTAMLIEYRFEIM